MEPDEAWRSASSSCRREQCYRRVHAQSAFLQRSRCAPLAPAIATTLDRECPRDSGRSPTARSTASRGSSINDQGKVVQVLRGSCRRRSCPSTGASTSGGRTLLPGLIDAHGHVMAIGFSALQLDLTGTRSLEDLQQRLKAYAAAHPQARWILGRGWNQELWPDRRFPTAADIDAVVSDRPVWLDRVDGHAAIANSAAMQAAGFSVNTVAPQGGRIENGLFVDAAMVLVESKNSGAHSLRAGSGAGEGSGTDARRRPHRCRGHGHQPRRLGGHESRGKRGQAQRPYPRLRGGNSVDDGNQRRPAERLAPRGPPQPRRRQTICRRSAGLREARR